MEKLRYYISAGIFIVLTCIKLLIPGAAAVIKEKTVEYINSDISYVQAVSYLTALRTSLFRAENVQADAPQLSDSKKTSALPYTPREFVTPKLQVEHRPAIVTPTESAVPTGSPEEIIEITPVPDPEPSAETTPPAETAPPVPDAAQTTIQTFLDSQASFSDYALPANVTYDYTALPFSYAVPVSGLKSSGFGYRIHPIQNEVKFHYGTDFAANSGENICAFADGTVSFAGYSDSYGNYITVEHADGWRTLYAHCSQLNVSSGDWVTGGQNIALVGATGLVTGPHLHFELTHNGVYVNPEYYVNSLA